MHLSVCVMGVLLFVQPFFPSPGRFSFSPAITLLCPPPRHPAAVGSPGSSFVPILTNVGLHHATIFFNFSFCVIGAVLASSPPPPLKPHFNDEVTFSRTQSLPPPGGVTAHEPSLEKVFFQPSTLPGLLKHAPFPEHPFRVIC